MGFQSFVSSIVKSSKLITSDAKDLGNETASTIKSAWNEDIDTLKKEREAKKLAKQQAKELKEMEKANKKDHMTSAQLVQE